jgi:hypothetical protein
MSKAKSATPETPPEVEFLGLELRECCVNCEPGKCVITGDGICGHPKKSGIQHTHKANPEIVRRYNRARKFLAEQALKMRNFGDE